MKRLPVKNRTLAILAVPIPLLVLFVYVAQLSNLRLIAPADGLVVARDADPVTTIVAGQVMVVLIDPVSLGINVRFDQMHARGLAANLPAQILLRSQAGELGSVLVLWVEPLADAVTEETLAKVLFDLRWSPETGQCDKLRVRINFQEDLTWSKSEKLTAHSLRLKSH